jgi:Transposase DDE domain group 1
MPARSLRGQDSAANLRVNQLRLWFASLAYVLMTALRRIALEGTELAQATAGTIRLKLLKLGALVTVSVRRIKIAIASACPLKGAFANAHRRLCEAAA